MHRYPEMSWMILLPELSCWKKKIWKIYKMSLKSDHINDIVFQLEFKLASDIGPFLAA